MRRRPVNKSLSAHAQTTSKKISTCIQNKCSVTLFSWRQTTGELTGNEKTLDIQPRKLIDAWKQLGNSQQLDPVCTVFVEKVPLEPTIPLNDALHTWFSAF
ncbi:hypothetical protein AVEN_64440-1 [Araneus ventricosus]|uniref:Uncharacterized protein n=1 Tax=Araneus ventricosus TaxID=182803 RepID=A0A4Y2UBA3_ARAVE|nr:hypothetical protein AVEN_64440-1 [Araneus ventricosus]